MKVLAACFNSDCTETQISIQLSSTNIQRIKNCIVAYKEEDKGKGITIYLKHKNVCIKCGSETSEIHFTTPKVVRTTNNKKQLINWILC